MIKYLDLKQINEPYEHAADEVLQCGWYLRGEATARFEQSYADYIGTRHAIGCGNGLDALTLILRAYKELGVMRDGDEVIVPANTYIASILAITECGLKPVLVEPSWETLQIDDALIEQHITPLTRAIMIVHLYGRCAYTDRIGNICRSRGLKLIEDNAQAHGCFAPHPSGGRGARTGALGDAAAHSFYPTKNLGAMGDAGAVTTDNDALAETVRRLGNYGSSRKYVFSYIGRNSRMDEIQAAILSAKLPNLDRDNDRRRQIALRYLQGISNTQVRIPVSHADSVYHIFPVFCSEREQLQTWLSEQGIGTEIHYPIPPHRQQCYAEWNGMSLPVTERIHAEELSLPCHPALTDAEVDTVIDAVNRFSCNS